MSDNLNLLLNSAQNKSEIQYFFSDKNPFFNYGEVKIFEEKGSILVGIKHKDYIYQGESFISFGYWLNLDLESSQKNFKNLEFWAKAQGASQIIGPINFSTLNTYRLPNFTETYFFKGEPKGSESDVEALNSVGFSVLQDYTSHYISHVDALSKWAEKSSKKVLRDFGHLKAISFKDFDYEKRRAELYQFINKVFANNLGFISATDYELNYLYSKPALDWLSQFPFFLIEDEHRNIVGIFSSFIDKDVFSNNIEDEALYFKTIATVKPKGIYNPIFFYLIYKLFESYKSLNKDIPICFALMRKGNVAENVAKKFSSSIRTYSLFYKQI